MVTLQNDPAAVVGALVDAGVGRGEPVGLALATGDDGRLVLGLATSGGPLVGVSGDDAVDVIAAVETAVRPRWVWWSNEPAAVLVRHGVRLGACWDLSAVHRLLVGGWRTDEVRIWSAVRGLDHRQAPALGQLDLGDGDSGEGEHPAVRADGYLRSEWVAGLWRDAPEAASRWAELALDVMGRQQERLRSIAAAGWRFRCRPGRQSPALATTGWCRAEGRA